MILANVCNLRFRVDNSIELIKKAIANLEITNDQLTLLHAIVRQGNYYWWAGQYDEASKSARKALAIMKSIHEESPEKISYSLYAYLLIGMSYYAKGEPRKVFHYVDKINQIDLSQLYPYDHMRVNLLFIHAALLAGNYEDSERYALKGMEITKVLENPYIYETFMLLYGRIKFITGYLDEAYDLAIKAQASGEANGNMYTTVQAHSLIGDIYHMLMNYPQAIQHYRLAQIRSGAIQSGFHCLQNDIHLARLLAQTGRVSEAKETIAHVLISAQSGGMKHLHSLALSVSALCDLIEHNLEAATKKCLRALEIAKGNDLRYEMVIGKIGQGHLALARQDYPVVEEIIKEIMPECQQQQSVWLLLNVLSLGIQLYRVQNKDIPIEYETALKSLIDNLQEQTKSDDLKSAFANARQYWEEHLHHP